MSISFEKREAEKARKRAEEQQRLQRFDGRGLKGLLTLFGFALQAKMTHDAGSFRLGKNYGNSHGPHHRERGRTHNPAGTKLVRRFIRCSRGEGYELRKLYAMMTGHQYNRAD